MSDLPILNISQLILNNSIMPSSEIFTFNYEKERGGCANRKAGYQPNWGLKQMMFINKKTLGLYLKNEIKLKNGNKGGNNIRGFFFIFEK